MLGCPKCISGKFRRCLKKFEIFFKNLKSPWAFSTSFLNFEGKKWAKNGPN